MGLFALHCALAWSLAVPVGDGEPFAGRELVVLVEERTFAAWPHLQQLARQFERDHPGLSVRVLDRSGAVGAQDKTRFMMSGNLQLDVIRIDVTEFAAFHSEGALVDLQPYFDDDPTWDRSEYFEVVDGFRAQDGHLFGLPSTFTPYVMYANLDILAREGIPRPAADWDWSALLEACRATTRDFDGDGRNDRYGISLTQWLQALVRWLWQNGGELLSEDGSASRLSAPEVIEALDFLRVLLHGERLASFDASFQNQFSQGLFQAGKCAFYGPVGYWETYRFQHIDAFRWDVLPLPRGERAATSIAMTGFVVPRTAREPELAYEFVRRLAGPDYQRMLASIGNGVPALRSAARSEAFLKPDVAPESEHVFLDVLDGARLMPNLANWRKIQDLCQAELERLLLDADCDVAATTRVMADKVDAFLQLERGRHDLPRVGARALAGAIAFLLAASLAGFLLLRGPDPGERARAEERQGYALIGLWAAGFLLLSAGPALATLVMSLCEWSPLRSLGDVRWRGLDNYSRLAGDGTFHTSLRVTLVYVFVSVPLGLAAALGLALLVKTNDRQSAVLRTLFYIPAVLAPVVVAAVWRYVFDAERGLVNSVLAALGWDGPAWLREPQWVSVAFVAMSLWSVGAQMLVFVAALQALDPALQDAARVDGATRAQRFWRVTLPGLGPVILFNAILGLVNGFQLFAQPYLMTQGGPQDESRFLVLYLYESGFRHLDMGYASALAWVMLAILASACAALFVWSRRRVHYAGEVQS